MTSSCCNTRAASGEPTPGLDIVCTLGAGDFRERTAAIRDLARRGLLASRRTDLRLELEYDPSVSAEVADMVAKESECCSFLGFDLRADGRTVHLVITAPGNVRFAADELFDHFVRTP